VVTESKQIKVLFLSPKGYFKDNIQHHAGSIRLTLLSEVVMDAANTDRGTEGKTPSALGKECIVLFFKFSPYMID